MHADTALELLTPLLATSIRGQDVYHVSVYHHNLSQFHFTAYDVRLGTDIIYTGTSHCNIATCR
jgi:hypothetical protein